jgi:hypothetical protein
MDEYGGLLEKLQEVRDVIKEKRKAKLMAEHGLVEADDDSDYAPPAPIPETDELDDELDALLSEDFGLLGRGGPPSGSSFPPASATPGSEPVINLPGSGGNNGTAITGTALSLIALYGLLSKKKRNKWGGNKGDMSRSRRDYRRRRK